MHDRQLHLDHFLLFNYSDTTKGKSRGGQDVSEPSGSKSIRNNVTEPSAADFFFQTPALDSGRQSLYPAQLKQARDMVNLKHVVIGSGVG
jgi:hypothetical protein